MATTSNIAIAGSIIGAPYGSFQIGPLTITNANLTGAIATILAFTTQATGVISNFATGAPDSVGIIYDFQGSGNTAALTLVGAAGDTGIALGATPVLMLTWPGSTPPTTLGFNVVAGPTAPYSRYIF